MPFHDLTSDHRTRSIARSGAHLVKNQRCSVRYGLRGVFCGTGADPSGPRPSHAETAATAPSLKLVPSLSFLLPSPVFQRFTAAKTTAEKTRHGNASYQRPAADPTTPPMGVVTAHYRADDPDAPPMTAVMITGRYAYSDDRAASLNGCPRLTTIRFATMQRETVLRPRHRHGRLRPFFGCATLTKSFRVTANTPYDRNGDHHRPTAARPASGVAQRHRLPDHPVFGHQGGNHDRSAFPSRPHAGAA
ncbi:hypothetical protein APED_04395 [Acanthopleuribacter pedis]